MMAKFKAKVTFSYNDQMHYPYEPNPYELPDEVVNELVAVGYAEIVEEPKPKRGKKDAVKNND